MTEKTATPQRRAVVEKKGDTWYVFYNPDGSFPFCCDWESWDIALHHALQWTMGQA